MSKENEIEEIKKGNDAILSAVKELTKTLAEFSAEFTKFRKAGKF